MSLKHTNAASICSLLYGVDLAVHLIPRIMVRIRGWKLFRDTCRDQSCGVVPNSTSASMVLERRLCRKGNVAESSKAQWRQEKKHVPADESDTDEDDFRTLYEFVK